MSYGLSQDQAIEDSLKRMGNPVEIGANLQSVHSPKIDWVIVFATILICIVGIHSLYSPGYATLQSIWMGLGILAAIALAFVKPAQLIKATPYVYLVTAVLLALSHIIGVSYLWQPYLVFGPIKIKIVDLSVPLFLFSIAGIGYQYKKKNVLTFILATIPMICFASIGSVFPGIVYFVSVISLITFLKFEWKLTALFTSVNLLILATKLQSERFIAANNLSTARALEAHTDFLFSRLTSTSPIIAIVALLGFGLLFTRMFAVSSEVKNPFSAAVIKTAAVFILINTMWGMLSSLAYIPVPLTGVNLPFISYGGSLIVANLALIGISLGAIRRKTLHLI